MDDDALDFYNDLVFDAMRRYFGAPTRRAVSQYMTAYGWKRAEMRRKDRSCCYCGHDIERGDHHYRKRSYSARPRGGHLVPCCTNCAGTLCEDDDSRLN